MQRTQIYLDPVETTLLDARAEAEGTTRSELIRRAVRDYLEHNSRAESELASRQKEALLAAFGSEPDLAESVTALREVDRRRSAELDERRGPSA